MARQRFLSSGNFAKLSRTTRNTLHLYDSIGLLPPASRGDNHYRYYSTQQLAMINVIRILQDLGMSLDEISVVKDRRTPQFIDELLVSQLDKIDKKIGDWVSARKLLLTLQKTIHSALNVDEDAITIGFLPAEAMILGDINDYSRGRDEYSALMSFYYAMHDEYPGLNLNYPVWGLLSKGRLERGDYVGGPDRYYFYNPEGYDKKPAGLYATGYGRGGYGQTRAIYRRITEYIEKNGFEISGDAYEEYPHNELSISGETNYLIRIMIAVREKKQDGDSG